ncbi:hypothetical protein BOTNAR_0201g00040 [Botryotinia narcissicola]|uniref:Uncharacterized protein n=1 Tax=Botryotinia narcissicola TaxID=278944 RepID=A0A4Z1I767_9HELO|nr:hypothetical protein BOTNAR_0201g00040 [Botryotinia narcissicola]
MILYIYPQRPGYRTDGDTFAQIYGVEWKTANKFRLSSVFENLENTYALAKSYQYGCHRRAMPSATYAEAKTYNTDLAKEIALAKPINGISKKVRARKTEFDIAARTGSATREEIITPGNLAAHSADVIIDARLVVEYDPKPGSSYRS